jgi:serine/threonine protein kinase
MNGEAELLFHELADLSPAQRENYFRERHVPPELRAEVEQLLHFDSEGGYTLTNCVAASAERLLQASSTAEENRRCGPYRLVRVLGRGGMGSVYLAERADGEVEHQVAIKFLRYGGEQPAFLDRFLRERQILALLSHPGIARLLDAGHTEDGRPYLVMEYIDGIAIDEYAERLDLRGTLTLFLRVCEAVSYAHRNLIIHRDIKPSNILVGPSGEPKLLDFGIAKILDASVNQTRTQEQLLTPAYASPEQCRGENQTTATDVYSLGAVLQKLVTGLSHYKSEGRTSQATEGSGGRLEASARRQTNLNLRTDIDYILRRALRPEPEQRYASAEAFANDIRAFLDSRPVQARSGDAWYRTRRFLQRYWAPVTGTALVIASLSAGLYVANRERAIADRRFQQVRQLSRKLIDLDAEIRDLPGTTKARSRIVTTSLEYLTALGPGARGDRNLALEIGEAYWQLARIQGVPIHSNLGQFEEAEKTLLKGDTLVESVLAADPDNRRALFAAAEIAHDRMAIASVERKVAEAMEQAHKAEAQLDRLASRRDLSPDAIRQIAAMYSNVAIACGNGHQYEDSIRAARRALEVSHGVASARASQSLAIGALASGLRWTGNLDGALDAIRGSLKILETTADAGVVYRLNLMEALLREGRILGEDGEISLNRPAEALVPLQRSLDLAEQMAAKDSHDSTSRHRVADAALVLGNILRHIDASKALVVYDRGLTRTREIENNLDARRDEVFLLAGSSYALRRVYRGAEAWQRIEAAFRTLREIKDYPAERVVPIDAPHAAMRALADHYAETGHLQKAADTYRELLEKVMASGPDPANDLRNATYISGDEIMFTGILRRLGRSDEAESMEARRQAIWRRWDRKLPNNPFVLRQIAAKPAG